jgi:hypothetical protein
MKNLLSENMMRFGTKNLSEAAQKELTLKSIMETINQHGLQKEVRNALNEQMQPWQIVQNIRVAMKGAGTNDKAIYDAIVGGIRDKATYDAVLAMVNKKGFKTVISYLEQDMQTYAANSFEEFFSPANNRITGGIQRHLQQFNPNEAWGYSGYHGSGKDAGGSSQGAGAETVRGFTGQ